MKRRQFFASLAASAAGILGLRYLRIFHRSNPPEEAPKVTVSINPLAVPRDKNRRRNG